jgi:hypothetical protein
MESAEELRIELLAALERAVKAHERADCNSLDLGFEEMESRLRTGGDSATRRIQMAFDFWGGWIDAWNHNWWNYKGITQADWPTLAKLMIDDLRQDRDTTEPRLVYHFAPRERVPLRARISRLFGRHRAV